MKYTLEMSETETLAFFQLIKFAIEHNRVRGEIVQKSLETAYKQVHPVAPKQESDSVSHDTKEESKEDFVAFPEPQLTEHQKKGRKHMKELLRFWLPNFRDEEKEQPDRGDYMNKLGIDGTKAGAVISYCMAVGGLTKAVWNLAQEMSEMENHRRDPDWIRYLAGHITQVASCHLGHLADEMEYPNPLLFLTREL